MPDREPPETAPNCREAGDECARTWWGVSAPPVPASVLAYVGVRREDIFLNNVISLRT